MVRRLLLGGFETLKMFPACKSNLRVDPRRSASLSLRSDGRARPTRKMFFTTLNITDLDISLSYSVRLCLFNRRLQVPCFYFCCKYEDFGLLFISHPTHKCIERSFVSLLEKPCKAAQVTCLQNKAAKKPLPWSFHRKTMLSSFFFPCTL